MGCGYSKKVPSQVNNPNSKRLSINLGSKSEDLGNSRKRLSVSAVNQEGTEQAKSKPSEIKETQGTIIIKDTQERQKTNRRISIEGAPSSQLQNHFEDKFVKVSGCEKIQPGQLLSDLGVSISCKKGLKPDSPNQDDFCVVIDGDNKIYGVFDGHGPYGHFVSDYVHKKLPQNLLDDAQFEKNPEIALKNAFIKTNTDLINFCEKDKAFDCSLSGTTATVMVHRGNKFYISHAGDSRAVMARKMPGNKLEAVELTRDHKPTLSEEKKRIIANNGEVKKMEGDIPHRVFVKGRPFPGLSMSRSIGDLVAQNVGVIPDPEVKTYNITSGTDMFVLICSDGVWEFIKNKEAVTVINNFGKAKVNEATETLATQAWGEWIHHEGNTVDDITVICVYLDS